ncbi:MULTISPECIES: sensor histidine kinase [Glycomyces]|uniref:Sensor histidine kinase n=2 Tax=Glycomyces TaxID=58113 RepID=A0A9X3TAA4_9ACTN|nr:sensor histidine kinase [Glycomyces lechevalierae]MDA1387493.1 sensor histidine kinase [Glycomyces lechevalierae]MDR7338669.1 two-component system sensor histidine kinase DesK [Glycomyces lechevalierae]
MTATNGTGTGWWSDDSTGPFAAPARWRWLIIGLAILAPFTIPVAADAIHNGAWSTLAVALAYGACYMVFPWAVAVPDLRFKVAFGFLILGLGWTLFAVANTGGVYGLLYGIIPVAMGLPLGWMLVLDGGTVAALGVFELLGLADALGAGYDYSDLWAMAGITTTLFFMVRLIRTVRRLRDANAQIAALAVAAERERLARDLHDLLGHSLTTITVKAGLARRLIETGSGGDRAIEEIRDVEALSRSALTDVRATVSEYREVSLAGELAGARAALRAADIDADLPRAVDDVDPALHSVFGYVVREAVTNAIRHSNAATVRVRLGPKWITVADDGRAKTGHTAGTGLRGLTERLAAAGGTLDAGPAPEGGFIVKAEVP